MGLCLSPPVHPVASAVPDAAGFPLLALPALGLACHLFPVTKVQFEFYLGGTPGADHAVYAEMLGVSPRTPWRTLTGWPGGVFATGVRPADAERFAGWLGDGFRLPTAAEWRGIDAVLNVAPSETVTSAVKAPRFHPAAAALVAWASGRAATWRTLGLFDDGFQELVTVSDHWHGAYGLHGRPRPGFVPGLLHNPQVHEARRVPDARQPGVAFRLVRTLLPGDAP